MIVPFEAIISTPAACPAEVTLSKEISEASVTESPALTAIMPKPKETDRYPKAIGIPCTRPFRKSFFLITSPY